MIFPESATAHKFLDGLSGIEIGGASHNPFNIAGCRNVDYTDDMTTRFKQSERELAGKPLPVDVVAAGDNLPFPEASLDYVLSSHVIEHFWDPIAAIKEWMRVLKPGGIIFMIVPHKERTCDHERPRTPLSELIARHARESLMPPDVDPTDHHSVWITEDVVELIHYLGLELLHVADEDDKVGNGFTVVFRKPGELPTRALPVDLGCGDRKRPGSIGVDKRPLPGVDFVIDLDNTRLPFDDDSVPTIYSNGLFGYLADPVAVLRDIVRVCKRGATVEIWTPHALNDGAALLGTRHRFSQVTWLELLHSDIFADIGGNLTLKEFVVLVPPPTVESLNQRKIPLDFAVRHLTNVVSRIGAVLTVHKPHAPPTVNYVQRVMHDPG